MGLESTFVPSKTSSITLLIVMYEKELLLRIIHKHGPPFSKSTPYKINPNQSSFFVLQHHLPATPLFQAAPITAKPQSFMNLSSSLIYYHSNSSRHETKHELPQQTPLEIRRGGIF
jgi:hypothetical protein